MAVGCCDFIAILGDDNGGHGADEEETPAFAQHRLFRAPGHVHRCLCFIQGAFVKAREAVTVCQRNYLEWLHKPQAASCRHGWLDVTLGLAWQVTDGGTLNLLSRSCGEYNINELGLQKRSSGSPDDLSSDGSGRERNYQCASHEMCIFGAIGWGASSVVRKAIHVPTHRILALKKINVFEKVEIPILLASWNSVAALASGPVCAPQGHEFIHSSSWFLTHCLSS